MLFRNLVFLSVVALSNPLCGEPLTDMAMTQQDRENIGIDRMTPQQKKALERWLDNWTRTVLIHAPSYHPSLSLTQWVILWKKEQIQKKIIEEENPEAAVHTIFRNKNGEVLELADGSLWNIVVFDQYTVSMWRRNEKVTISPNKYDLTRPYTIYNIARNEQAGAQQQRKAFPNGKRPKEPSSYFANSHTIDSIGINGTTVTINEKEWNIAPIDQARVVNNWQILDRIRVTKSNDLLYPSKLENLDSGDSANAK